MCCPHGVSVLIRYMDDETVSAISSRSSLLSRVTAQTITITGAVYYGGAVNLIDGYYYLAYIVSASDSIRREQLGKSAAPLFDLRAAAHLLLLSALSRRRRSFPSSRRRCFNIGIFYVPIYRAPGE